MADMPADMQQTQDAVRAAMPAIILQEIDRARDLLAQGREVLARAQAVRDSAMGLVETAKRAVWIAGGAGVVAGFVIGRFL